MTTAELDRTPAERAVRPGGACICTRAQEPYNCPGREKQVWKALGKLLLNALVHTANMSANDKPLGGRVAVVGTGSRAAMFVRGIIARPNSQVVAICEPNAVRAEYYNKLLEELGAQRVPVYQPDQFKEMLATEKVETVVVTCVDALHDLYIVPALEAGGEFCLLHGQGSYETDHHSAGIDREAHDHGRGQVSPHPRHCKGNWKSYHCDL